MAAAREVDLAIVGAGPYGVSLAASNPGLRTVVFGRPLETWRQMDPAMQLRAATDEMDLHAAGGSGAIRDWQQATGTGLEEPLRVDAFLSYGRWFVDRFVPDLVPEDVVSVTEGAHGRLVVESSGHAVSARSVVVSVGITPFPHAPPALEPLVDGNRVAFATDPSAAAIQAGERVAVIGAGQSAVEAAARAADAGAAATLIARKSITWFADREPSTPRGPLAQRLYELLYPAVGYGPPPLNRLVLEPDVFALLPDRIAKPLTARLLRPGASPWLRRAVDEGVTVREGVSVSTVDLGREVRLGLSDGTPLTVDRLLLGTGYRFRLDRLAFLGERVRAAIRVRDGWPVLDRWFRSTDPRVTFVGYAAEGRFGPISRFVLGVPFTTRRVSESLRRTA
jgi:FAD-dependent urate hydroxylase